MSSAPEQTEGVRGHLDEVARSGMATLAGAAASTLATFGLVVVLTRSVQPDVAGRFFAATALFAMALATAGLGTDTGLARYVLRSGSPAEVRRLLRLAAPPVLVASVALATLLAVVAPATRPLVWALPCAAAADLCLGAVRAHASFASTVAIDRVLRPALQLVLVTVVIVAGLPGSAIAVAWACAYVVSALLATRSLNARLRIHRERAPADRGETDVDSFWSFTSPRAVARIAQVAIQKVDIVLVAWLLTPADAAAYTVATRFVVFGQLANQAISSVVQPRFTLLLAGPDDDRAALSRVFGTTTCWSVLLAWPVYACVAAAPAAYLGWFGGSYVTGENQAVALVMALGMLVAVASGPVDTLLLMLGRSGRSLANTLVALGVDVALCLVLVPRLGIVGAALAWAASVVLRCVLALVQLRADVRLRLDRRMLLLAGVLPLTCIGAPLLATDRAVGLGPGAWLAGCLLATAGYAAVVWRLRERLVVDVLASAISGRRHAAALS